MNKLLAALALLLSPPLTVPWTSWGKCPASFNFSNKAMLWGIVGRASNQYQLRHIDLICRHLKSKYTWIVILTAFNCISWSNSISLLDIWPSLGSYICLSYFEGVLLSEDNWLGRGDERDRALSLESPTTFFGNSHSPLWNCTTVGASFASPF